MADSKQSITFSILFSDLMMGAMGVMIVLIVFLQVTTVRGTSSSLADDSLRLPEGFREGAAGKFAKVRTVVCGDGKEHIRFEIAKDVRKYTSNASNNCLLTIYVFDKGVGEGNTLLKAQEDISGRTSIDLQISIAGFSTTMANGIVRLNISSNETLAIINVSTPDVLYEGRGK